MVRDVDNKEELYMLVLLVFTLFNKKSMLCWEDYCSGVYLGGRRETISPPAALLGLVRGMGLAKGCSGCPRGLPLEGTGLGTTFPCPDQ